MPTNNPSETDDDLYIRQNLVPLGIPEEISIVGCGGTGSWVGFLTAMVGVKRIHLFDDDILENHNRSRLPYPQDWVGKKKTECLKQFIQSVRPECMVMTYGGIYNDTHLILLAGSIVFDCNDDFTIQKMVAKYCKSNKLRYIGVGCNADHITIREDISKVWSVGDGQDRYQVTPMFIVPPMVASLCAVWNIFKHHKDVSVLNSISFMFTDAYKKSKVSGQCGSCLMKSDCAGCQECGNDLLTPCIHCPVTSNI